MSRPRKFPCSISNKYGAVKIYRTTNGRYTSYKIVWQEGASRKKESRPDEVTAVNRANEILDDMTKGIPARSDATGDQWAYYRRCEEMLEGVPLINAVEFFLEHGRKQVDVPKISVQAMVDKFIEAKKSANRCARYCRTASYHLNAMAKVMHKPLSMVHVADIDAFLGTITNLRTRYNYRASIVTAWRWARSKGWLPRDRATAAELTDCPEYVHKDPGIVSAEMLKELLTAVVANKTSRDLVPYLVIAAFAGVRSAEIRRMSWEEHVNMEDGTIILGSDVTKMRRRRVIYMEPVLLEWLNHFKSTGPVVKVTDPHRKLAAVRTGVWPHNALRHSAISYLMALHRNAALVAEQCGHTEAELQASYKANTTSEQSLRWFNTKPDSIWQATQTQPGVACA